MTASTHAESDSTQGAPLLKGLVRRHLGGLVPAAALVSMAAVLELVPHVVVYLVTLEIFSPSPQLGGLLWLAVAAFAGVLLRFALIAGGYVLSHAVAFGAVREVQLRLAAKLARVPGGFFDSHSSGDLKKTLVEDVMGLEGVLAHNLPETASAVIVPTVAFVWLVSVDWRLALLSLALLPVAVAVQMLAMGNMRAEWERWHKAERTANEGILEFLRGIPVLKSFDREARSFARVRDGIHTMRDMAIGMTDRSVSGYSLFSLLIAHNLLVTLPAGLAMLLGGWIGRADFVLFVVLGMGMTAPLMKMLFVFGAIPKTQVALRRIQAVLDADELPPPLHAKAAPEGGDLRFSKVSFRYQHDRPSVLEDVSFAVPAGSITAIVGPSGAGKTTVTRLITRAWDALEGSITIGGVDVRDLRADQLVSLVSRVSQDTTLFDGTVRDNLLLARGDATQEQLEAAARAAQAHDFIEKLPQGYDTPLGDRGAHLSGGERQRLTIARALLKDAPIIVLDEVTANVDPENERLIQEGLAALVAGRTVLIVAHRLRTIEGVDQIVVMDKGRVGDRGSHDELLERSSTYALLWQAQEQANQWSLQATGGAA